MFIKKECNYNPNPTISNKRVFLLVHARSVFDDVINQYTCTGRNILRPGVADGLGGVWFASHAEGPGVEPRGECDNKIENVSPVLIPSYHLR